MKLRFSIILLAVVVITMVASITSAATTAYASHHSSGSSDKSGSSSGGSNGGSGSGSQGSQGINPPPATTPPPNPPPNPLPNPSSTKCPDGSTPDSSGKCPQTVPPPPTPCPNGAQPDKNGNCPPPPPPKLCPDGSIPVNGKCPSIHECKNGQVFIAGHRPCEVSKDCFTVGVGIDGIRVVCPTIVVHNTHTTVVQQAPPVATTNTNDINLLIVTTCTADFNDNQFPSSTAALCDSTITMMHNDGLDAQLPQVDLYLKARGLLQ